MKKIEIIAEKENYSAVNIGDLDELDEYTFFHPQLKKEIPGKTFTGNILKSSGAEVSFQTMPPKSVVPFFHKHHQNEEIYIVLKGCGQFQIDDDIINIKEGSIIRICPQGKRTWRNNSNEPMTLMVIQSKQGSLEHLETSDGFGVKERVRWNRNRASKSTG